MIGINVSKQQGGDYMSIEAAKSFIERMETDEKFNKKITACKDPEERMALVKTEGYDFTKDEIKQIKGRLTDEQLDNITGGGCICADIWCGKEGEADGCFAFF